MKKFSKIINQESAVWMNNGWNGNTEFKMKSGMLPYVPVLKIKLFSIKLIKNGSCSLSLNYSYGRTWQRFEIPSLVNFWVAETGKVRFPSMLPWFYLFLQLFFCDSTVQGQGPKSWKCFYLISRQVALCLGRCSLVDWFHQSKCPHECQQCSFFYWVII